MARSKAREFANGIRDGYGEAITLDDACEYAANLTPIEWNALVSGGYDNGFALGTEIAEWEGKYNAEQGGRS